MEFYHFHNSDWNNYLTIKFGNLSDMISPSTEHTTDDDLHSNTCYLLVFNIFNYYTLVFMTDLTFYLLIVRGYIQEAASGSHIREVREICQNIHHWRFM